MGPITSVMLIVHAVYLLFYSTINIMRRLIPLYGGIFAIAGLKIIFYDMRGFSIFEKIIAFTVIGLILLVSAFVMQKYFADKNNG